jgi:lipopolysaccharide export system protein LptC
MKDWHSQLFPIVLLALLAGLTFWLQQSVSFTPPPSDGKFRHDPDAIAETFSIKRYDENGILRYRLVAPLLVHYPDDDSSLITSPTLVSYRPDAPPVTLSGRNAKLGAGGEVIFLWDEVSVRRAATADRSEMIATMPDLTVQPDAGFAFTSSPVEIRQGLSWMKGTGMELDNNKSTLVLQSQVTGMHYPVVAPQ